MTLDRCLRVFCFPSHQITIWQIPVQQHAVREDEQSDGNQHANVGTYPSFSSMLLSHCLLSWWPLLFIVYILSISQSTCWFPFLLFSFPLSSFFQLSHLTWSHFVYAFDYSLFAPFCSCGLLWCWWILRHLFSEETRIQRKKTWASLQFGSWQQPQHVLSA